MAKNDDLNEKWFEDRLSALDSARPFQPDVAGARGRLRSMQSAAATRTRRAVLALASACVLLAALPWPRALAQELWNRLLLGRVEVVRVDRTDLPEEITAVFTMEPEPFELESVRDAVEAERLAGFRPLLPPAGVLAGTPKLSIVRKVTLATRPLKVADIERALAAAGVSGVPVPKEWEGTTLVAEGGPLIAAEYEGVELMQSAPFRVNTPPGFQFVRFMETAFRVFGRTAAEAKVLAQKFEANPALVLHLADREAVREIPLRSGHGIIVTDPAVPQDACFFWNTADRIFIVDAKNVTDEALVNLANSIR